MLLTLSPDAVPSTCCEHRRRDICPISPILQSGIVYICAGILQLKSAQYSVEVDDAARICINPVSPGKGGLRPEKVPHAGLRRLQAVFSRVRQLREVISDKGCREP